MQLIIADQSGRRRKHRLRPQSSQFIVPSLRVLFSDSLASRYKPVIYGGDYSDPPPQGIYYRIVQSISKKEYCIQYYLYWLEQDCFDFLPIADHQYDYEPIFVFLKPPRSHPVGVANAGVSHFIPKGATCRFHKAEIRREEYEKRDRVEKKETIELSPEPFYPFGRRKGRQTRGCVKKYPMAGAIYFDNSRQRPLFGIVECSHVFSGAEKDLLRQETELSIPLKRLSDDVLFEWYFEHRGDFEAPFGHDVSDPFRFPCIRYFDSTQLRSSELNRLQIKYSKMLFGR